MRALDMGADDYITKPFGAAELLARVRVAIRHTRSSSTSPSIAATGKFTAGELTIDYDKHQVLINGVNAKLTQNEFRIVSLLGKCAGRVLTYDFIMKELWGPQSKGGCFSSGPYLLLSVSNSARAGSGRSNLKCVDHQAISAGSLPVQAACYP